jgi:adenylate cyclase class 2
MYRVQFPGPRHGSFIRMITREIEVKARVRDIAILEEKLRELGCQFSSPLTQVDRIFIPHGLSIPVEKGINVLRLRKEKDRILFTLKQVHGNQLDKIEKEFIVSDAQQALETIQLLGFDESVMVEKTRRKCRYKEYEICLDSVKGLGEFIEVEKISSGETKIIQDELFTFLESLGVLKADQEFVGYDILLYNKNQSS